MFKRFWIGLALFVFLGLAGIAFGQNCDSIVSDEAGILGSKSGAVEEAAKTINSLGADARVVTVSQISGTLEDFLGSRKTDCPSWRSSDGGIKSNLVVFALSLKPKKLQIYYGREIAAMIGSSQNAIKAQFMAPAFHDGDYARGFIQGETQVGLRIHAFNEAALHPVNKTTQVTNQATDFSGLWWCLGILILGLGVWAIIALMNKSRKRKEAVTAAQQDAVQTSSRVADTIGNLTSQYTEKKALGEVVDDKIGAVNLVSQQYARLGNSESTNPATPGLSADQYSNIAKVYQRLMDQLNTIQRPAVAKSDQPIGHSRWSTRAKANSTPSYSPTTTPPASTHTTVYVDNSPNYVPIPIIVDEPVYREREPDPEPTYSHSSRSDDSDSGSSSSYDSGSSSSYDSGSSSDYSSSDSGSSDSGSSSDF